VCDDGNCCDAHHCEQTCQAAGQTCDSNHPCCHPGVLECGSQGICCISDGQQGNSNHPDLCCSGCLCEDGTCCDASNCQQCSDDKVPCGAHCIDPTTECCADEEVGTLCQAEGYKTKCCPGLNRPCNKHEKSKTFDCGKKPKNRKRKQRRGK
jgi:hypothetical protein